MAQLSWFFLFLFAVCWWPAQATAQTSSVAAVSESKTKPAETGITELKGIAGSNSIPLLDNRFRIDYAVEEVTLVFFRKKGAQSIVLVKPDGSKVYARTAKEHNMQWFDDKTYDLIKMTKPTPGPWQAVGEILPESRIMVLTEIDLKADQLPADLMIGEIFKVTARLSNGGKPINTKDFSDILQLDVVLISTQNAEYENAAASAVDFASFQDDGKNYDERPRDAIFTGEFNLKIVPGEWLPKFVVKTPLYTRELLQKPIVVRPFPLKLQLTEAKDKDSRHQISYQVTSELIVADSLSVQGRLWYPGGEIQSFVLAEQAGSPKTLEVSNFGAGTYRIEQMVYGKTAAGREFVIHYPEYKFEIAAEPVKTAESDDTHAAQATEPKSPADKVEKAVIESAPAEEPAQFPLGLVVTVNVLILLAGGIAIVLSTNSMLLAKLNPLSLLKKKKTVSASGDKPATETAAGSSDPASAAAVKKPPKNKASDDILDLSLPDD